MTDNTVTAGAISGVKRKFLPDGFSITDWKSIEPFYVALTSRVINSKSELIQWLVDLSELEAAVEEHAGWLYIRMTCNTQDKKLTQAYTFFVEEVNPQIEPFSDKLNKKLIESASAKELDGRYQLYLKGVENEIRLFREENISLEAELTVKEQQYGETAGAMTVEVNGNTLTLQQASNFLKDPNRKLRDEVYHKIFNRRSQDRDKLDSLFNELIRLRGKIASNAGFQLSSRLCRSGAE